MEKWDGVERRHVDKDWIERDRLLTETHTNVCHIVSWAKDHDKSDNERFQLANKRISWVEKVAYLGIGGLAVLNGLLHFIK